MKAIELVEAKHFTNTYFLVQNEHKLITAKSTKQMPYSPALGASLLNPLSRHHICTTDLSQYIIVLKTDKCHVL